MEISIYAVGGENLIYSEKSRKVSLRKQPNG